MLREVLTQVEPVDSSEACSLGSFLPLTILVQLPHAPVGEVLVTAVQLRVEAFADNTTPGLKSSHAPLSAASPVPTSSPVLWAHTLPPPALPCPTSRPLALQLGSHPSCSSSVPNPRSVMVPLTVYLMTNVTRGLAFESRKSPLTTVAATDPMSMPDQLPWSPGVIPLPSKVAENESPSSILGMLRVTDVTPLPNTAMLAVGTVFHMSSLSLAMEFSPKPGAKKQYHQLATAPTSLRSSSSIPPLVQPRVTLTPITLWLWRTLGVWEIEKIETLIMGRSQDDALTRMIT